jgi:hypothetical protein
MTRPAGPPPTTEQTRGAIARAYAQRRWPVFPLHSIRESQCSCGAAGCKSPGKHPRTARGLTEATSDSKQVAAWWRQWPDANIALRTGDVFVVLDVDPKHGGDEALAELEAAHGRLPETWRVKTGGGGAHLFFQPPLGAPLRNSAGKLGPGLDVRGVGGYVVAGHSNHISGSDYVWDVELHPALIPLAPMPEWMVALLRAPTAPKDDGTDGTDWVALLQGVPAGQRNDAATRIAGHFARRGLPAAEVAEILLGFGARCRPPIDPTEQAAFRDIARRLVAKHHGAPAGGQPAPSPPAAAMPLRVPDEALIGLGRNFAELFARYVEVPVTFFYFAFLTYFGAAVARKITLESIIKPQPRLYTVLLGESADTRKSTGEKLTRTFFRSLVPYWDVPTMLGVGSGEGLAAELTEHPDLILAFDEFKAFVDKARMDGSVLLPMVGSLFEANDHDNRTKKERVTVRGAALSLVACCTIETYGEMFDRMFHSIGFLNRLWVVTDRSPHQIAVPREIPPAALDPVRHAVIERLRAIDRAFTANGGRPVSYPLTPGALACFEGWYRGREGSVFEKRLDTYGHRLLLLLAATTGREEIDEDLAERVVALLRWQLEVRREVDPVDAENRIAAMEEKIRRALKRGALRERDLMRMVHYDRAGIWTFEAALENLAQRSREVVRDRQRGLVWLASVTTVVTTPECAASTNGDQLFSDVTKKRGGTPSQVTQPPPGGVVTSGHSGNEAAGLPRGDKGGDNSGDSTGAPPPVSEHSEACDCLACVAAVTAVEDWP